MLGTISAIILALALVFGGGGATVYAAQNSMPEDMLYPLKLASEDARLGFTKNEESQSQLLFQFLEKRFDEVDALMLAGENIPVELADRLQLQLEAQLQLALGLGDDEMQQTLTQFQTMLANQQQEMLMLGQPDDVDPEFNRVQTMTQEQLRLLGLGLEDPTMLREQIRLRDSQPDDKGPSEDPNGLGNGGEDAQPGPGEPCEDCMPEEPQGNGPGYQQPVETQDPQGTGEPNEDGQNGSGSPAEPTPDPVQDGNGNPSNGPENPTGSPDNGNNGGDNDVDNGGNGGGDNGGENGGGNGGGNGGT